MIWSTVSTLLILFSLLLYIPADSYAQRPKLTPPPGKSMAFYLAKGGRFLETGDYTQAIVYLDAALRAPRKGVKPAIIQLAEKLRKSAGIYQEARIARESGQAEAAVEKYRQIMQINPTDPRPLEFIIEIYDLLSEAAEKRNDYQEAARLYECWLQYDPHNDLPRKGLIKNLKAAAAAAAAQGATDTSLALYRKLASIDPGDPATEATLRAMEKEQAIGAAEAKLQLGELDAAITDLNSILNSYPNEPRLIEDLRLARGRRARQEADALMADHHYHEAFNFYQKAAALLPEERNSIGQHIAEIQLRTGANYRSEGILRARGDLTAPAKVAIAGKTITYLEGKENLTLKLFGESLPARPFEPKIEHIEGDVLIRIVEYPNRSNNYSLVLQLLPKNGRSFAFELNWELQTSGSVSWRGRIDGRAVIWLQGPFVDQTGSVRDAASSYDPLPHEDYSLAIAKLQGGESVRARIIESPTPTNDYAAAVEVTTRGAEEVELKIDWMTDRSTKRK